MLDTAILTAFNSFLASFLLPPWSSAIPFSNAVAAREHSSTDLTSSASAALKSAFSALRTSVASYNSLFLAAMTLPSVAISSDIATSVALLSAIVASRSPISRVAVSIAYPLALSSSSQKTVYSSMMLASAAKSLATLALHSSRSSTTFCTGLTAAQPTTARRRTANLILQDAQLSKLDQLWI